MIPILLSMLSLQARLAKLCLSKRHSRQAIQFLIEGKVEQWASAGALCFLPKYEVSELEHEHQHHAMPVAEPRRYPGALSHMSQPALSCAWANERRQPSRSSLVSVLFKGQHLSVPCRSGGG